MGRATSLLLASLGAAIVSGRGHVERALVTDAEGPNSRCPAPTITTIIAAQGVYYSQIFESASQILNFYGNETITVQDAPTTIVQNTYITTTIVQTTGGPTTSGSPATITGATSTVLTLVHNNAQPTVYTTVTTGSDGQTTTVTSALPSLTLGEGIPAGTSVTSIPTQSPLILAIGPAGGGAKFKRDEPDLVRRQASASPTATAASFAQNGGGSTGNNCGFATRYTLNNGMLQSGNDTVGKDLFALYAPLIPSDQVSQVNITFFFNNGVLSWSTTDVQSMLPLKMQPHQEPIASLL